MSTQAVTPDPNANPFDTPLPSEVNEHQQAVAASSTGNPFDEPLPSEKAEQQVKLNPEQQASNIRQSAVAGMTGMPTPNMSDTDRTNFESGKRAGAITAGGAEVLSPLLPATGELADLAIKHLAGNVLPGMETEAAKQTLLRAIPSVKQLIGYGLSYEGLKHLWGAVTGGKGK